MQPVCLDERHKGVNHDKSDAREAARKKAIVGIARQLAVDCWRWRTGKVTPETLGWVMVGPPA